MLLVVGQRHAESCQKKPPSEGATQVCYRIDNMVDMAPQLLDSDAA